MDVNLDLICSSLALLATIYLLQILVVSLLKPEKKLPPSPPSLPIVGHLHLFKPPFHRTFLSLAQTHGPIFSLRLGHRLAVVVSSPSAVEECLARNDVVFANRPRFLSGMHLAYNYSLLIWAPYGPHWRNLRRIITLFALSTKKIEQAGPTRKAEVRAMVRELVRSSKGEGGAQLIKVNLNGVFAKLTRNLVMRMLNGKPWEYPMIITPSPVIMNICDFIPVLRWVGYKGIEREMIEYNKERDAFLQKLMDECREGWALRPTGDGQGKERTLIEELLDLQEAEPDYYSDDILKGIILAIIVAGSDTSARTLEWAMSLLMSHPEVLAKARSEIDTHVDPNTLVDDSDLPNLSYIHCIIHETLRLFPPTPCLLPHYSSSDCTIGGFHVPKGTILFVNAWALHRDPALWEEPTMFKPERFDQKERDHSQGSFKYMPFGVGRRSCPGNNMALRNVTLALATLIQCFEWEMDGDDQLKVDLDEDGGPIVMYKDKPLHAVLRPRSSMNGVLQSLCSEGQSS